MDQKQTLPNATAVLVLGICSLVFSCFYVGLILGIIGIVIGAKSKKVYQQNPTMYLGYPNLNAGYIMSIIGTILSSIYILWIIFVGRAALSILQRNNVY